MTSHTFLVRPTRSIYGLQGWMLRTSGTMAFPPCRPSTLGASLIFETAVARPLFSFSSWFTGAAS